MKYGSDKEVAAVTHNLKEEQYLEKTIQTLSLEESYAVKLLELDHQLIKHQYKNFKVKVAKIKSYLPADEILQLKLLEQRGKMKNYCNTINLGTASKIAAASRRLKLGSHRRATTDPPKHTAVKVYGRGDQLSFPRRHRSNSITGIMVDLPAPNGNRRNSFDGSTMAVESEDRVSDEISSAQGRSLPHARAQTAQGGADSIERNKQLHIERQRDKTKRAKTAHGFRTFTSYSSHPTSEDSKAKEDAKDSVKVKVVGEETDPKRPAPVFNDSANDAFGADPYRERRKALIECEKVGTSHWNNRKWQFFGKVDKAIEDNPPFFLEDYVNAETVIRDVARRTSVAGLPAGSAFNKKVRKTRRGPLDNLSEEEERQHFLQEWHEMRKCRYLRLSSGVEDLSGVNTLAVDQLKMAGNLKYTEKGKKHFNV